MSGQEKTKILIQGTAILAAAALLTKMMGVIYRIPYQNITGNLGFYVYQQVYPLYSLLLILATAGIPIAISKLVAERLAVGDDHGARRVFHTSAIIMGVSGVIFFFILYGSAPALAHWMEDERLIMPIRSVSYALLIVPVMGAIRGYFQGHQYMVPTAISQIVEQIIRVTTILVLSYWFINNQYDAYYAGAGAVFGAVTGAISALIVLLFFWNRVKHKREEEKKRDQASAKEDQGEKQHLPLETTWQLIKKIFYYSIPICIGALVLPLFQIVDALTVVKMLIHSNWEHLLSRELKGIYDRGQPLVQFSAFFVTALALALVPSISDAHARKDKTLIAYRSEIAMRLTLLIGLAASFGLAIVAGPVNIMLYKTDEGTFTLAILSFTTIFSTLGVTSAAILQGLGQVILPARNLFIGVIAKLGLNLLLIPIWDITGAAVATVVAYAVATLLNMWALYRLTHIQLSFKAFVAKPLLSVAGMVLCVWLSRELFLLLFEPVLEGRIYFTAVTLLAVTTGVVTYAIALLRFGAVQKRELETIPKLNRLVPYLVKIKILPR